MSLIFLGIDPGLATTGFGVISKNKSQVTAQDYGCILTDKKADFVCRLKTIYTRLLDLIACHKPDFICLEELFFCNNVKTAIAVGQARGVMLLSAVVKEVPILEFTPLAVKQSLTGYGRADKKQMQLMVQKLLRLDKFPQPDDAADALAIALCGAFSQKILEIENKIGYKRGT